MPEAWLELDTTLKERIRVVLADPERLVTEAELRKLAEDGGAYSRILGAELERLEHRLDELDADPTSPLSEIGPAFRRVHDFREHIDELDRLLSALETRAREVRTSRLLGTIERRSAKQRAAPEAVEREPSEERARERQ